MLVGRRRRLLDYLRATTSSGTGRSSPSSACAASTPRSGLRAARLAVASPRPARSLSVASARRSHQSIRPPTTGNWPPPQRLTQRESTAHGRRHSVSGPDRGTDDHLTSRDGQARPAGRRRRRRAVGDTLVLVTATAGRSAREGIDFFPLTVDVEERMYAAGKIPGSFFRREGRPSEDGDPHLPAHRPPAAPAFPDGLPQRGPGRRHDPRRRPGEPARRAVDQRRVGGAAASRASRSTARSAPCAWPTPPTASGSPTRPTRRATSRPSRSSSPAVSSTTATSPS